MTVLLVVALAAPLAGAAAVIVVPERGVSAVRVAAVVTAACWALLLVDGSRAGVGPFHTAALPAAGALGAAVIVAAIDLADRPPTSWLALALCLTAAGASFAAGGRATNGAGVVAGLAITLVLGAWGDPPEPRVWIAAASGLAACAVAVFALRAADDSWLLAVDGGHVPLHRPEGGVLLLGAVLLVLAGTQAARLPLAVLVPGGLFLACGAAPLLRGADGFGPAAVVLAALACVAALAARGGEPLLDRPVASLALLSMAALVGPGAARPAGLLLAGGATLAAALASPASAALGLPGAISLALALAARGGTVAFAEGAFVAIAAAALAAGAVRTRAERPSPWELPAIAAGAWLLVAPGSWAWAGHPGLRAYDLGAGRAAAAAALVVVALTFRSRVPARWYARSAPQVSSGEDAVRH